MSLRIQFIYKVVCGQLYRMFKRKAPVVVTYHYVTWCPYCKLAKPIWDDAKSRFSDVTFVENNEELFRNPSITGYPAITLNNGSHVIKFDRPRTVRNLVEWIRDNK
jgi:thiol-disulfide isomerase/thioredoxin